MIHRIRPINNFTLIHNEPVQDPGLSWKAKGLLVYLMSLPDDWKVSITDLCNRSTDGRSATTAAMDELIQAGYAKKVEFREGGKFSGIDYVVSSVRLQDEPFCENLKTVPISEKPFSEKPFTGNQQLQINNNQKTKDKEILFSESEIFNQDVYKERFAEEAALGIDILFYWHGLDSWTEQLRERDKRKRRTNRGWEATIRTFMRRDKQAGRLAMKKQDELFLTFLNI